MPSQIFRHERVAIRVTADEPALAWLREFGTPGLVHDPRAHAAYGVTLRVDAARHAELARVAAGAPGRGTPCFALDTRVVTLPRHDEGGRPVLDDARYGVFHRVLADGVEIVAAPGPRAGRLPLLRVVREIVSEALLRSPDRVQLHAAAVAVDGRATLFAAGKGAGKTTLLAHRLLAGGASYVANDRVVVRLAADSAEVAGLPTVVSVRPGTIDRLACLVDGVPHVEHPSHHSIDELAAARATHPPFPLGERLRLTPAQWCVQVGAAPVEHARIEAIVVPSIDASVGTHAVERLSHAEAAAALGRALYGGGAPRDEPTPFEALVGGGRVTDVAPLLRRLAACVPVLACRLGPDAYRSAAGAPSLFDAVARCAR